MDILVLVKNVPEAAQADLEITDDGSAVDTDDLVFAINEWDNYAVEEAVRLKEAHGGTVTLLTLGDCEAEDVLRRGLAMGGNRAVHICDDDLEAGEPAAVVEAMAKVLAGESFDLILAGVQSSDMGHGQSAVLLAQRLGLPHATMAVGLAIDGDQVEVVRELEANTSERVRLPLPAVITVQSGINQPRYVSIMGIRKVRKIAVELHELEDLDLAATEAGASLVSRRKLFMPQAGQGAEILTGSLEEVCDQAAAIIREKGGLA